MKSKSLTQGRIFKEFLAECFGLQCHYCHIPLTLGSQEGWPQELSWHVHMMHYANDKEYAFLFPNGIPDCVVLYAQLDHVIPRSKGGEDNINNVVFACGYCNSTKGAKLLTEWQPRRVHKIVPDSTAIRAELLARETAWLQGLLAHRVFRPGAIHE